MPKKMNIEETLVSVVVANPEGSQVPQTPYFIEHLVWEEVKKNLQGSDHLPKVLFEHPVDKSTVRAFAHLFGKANVATPDNPFTAFLERIRTEDSSLMKEVKEPMVLQNLLLSVENIESKVFKGGLN